MEAIYNREHIPHNYVINGAVTFHLRTKASTGSYGGNLPPVHDRPAGGDENAMLIRMMQTAQKANVTLASGARGTSNSQPPAQRADRHSRCRRV